MRRFALPLVLALTTVTCGPSAEEQATAAAAAEAAAEDSMMAEVQTAFDASVYDTITWDNDQARMDRGQQVYTISCSKCHGVDGLGDAEFVMGADTLMPPSFQDPAWGLAEDEAAVRRAIFVGTTEGMPHWGLEGIKAEMVDAVAHYIMEGLGSN